MYLSLFIYYDVRLNFIFTISFVYISFVKQEFLRAAETLVHQHMGSQHQQPHRQRGRKTSNVAGESTVATQLTFFNNYVSSY